MSDRSDGQAASTATETPLTPLKGLLVLAAIIVVVAGFIVLNSAFGIHEFWAGFLFLLYWAGIEHMAFDRLAACVVGALIGLVMAWLLFALPGWLGKAGSFVFLGLILVLIYCQVMAWLPVAVNMMTMLFLTAGTIPAVQSGADFAHAFVALGLAFVYFIGLAWIASLVKNRKATAIAAA